MTERPASRAPASLSRLARLTLPLAVTVAIASLMGLLSWHFWVILLFPVALGVSLGWTSAFAVVAFGGRPLSHAALIALALLGFAVEQGFEDHHQRRAFTESLFEARAASSGLAPAEIERLRAVSGTGFLARGADELLDQEIEARLGVSGAFGRWVSRLDAGVRLGGPYRGGRGLEVGLPGGVSLLLIELLLVVVLARRIGGATPAR
jgi:hypothetical protein